MPIFLCHGPDDEQVDYANSVTAFASLEAAGAEDVHFFTVEAGKLHSPAGQECIARSLDFLNQVGADSFASVEPRTCAETLVPSPPPAPSPSPPPPPAGEGDEEDSSSPRVHATGAAMLALAAGALAVQLQ